MVVARRFIRKRFHHRCAWCHRPIKVGNELWLRGQPYGASCFEKASKMEVVYEKVVKSHSGAERDTSN